VSWRCWCCVWGSSTAACSRHHIPVCCLMQTGVIKGGEMVLVVWQVAAAEQRADAELDLLMRDLSGYDKPPSMADLMTVLLT
jgi:hypothetical protein